MDYISRIKLDTELIIAGFVEGMATIVETDEKCGALIREHFSTIGEGRYLAHSVLLHRAHEDHNHLGTTLYQIFEAKRYAERVRSVGKQTSITVLAQDDPPRLILNAGLERLEALYNEFGPQDIKGELHFDDDHFTEKRKEST